MQRRKTAMNERQRWTDAGSQTECHFICQADVRADERL